MIATLIEAFKLVLAPDVLIAIAASSVYGLVIGSLPGPSATMATALLVPVTFYLSPIAAVATIVSASAMAIFSGDIPGALLRIPGTPASAAYADEAYAMTRKGQAELALGAGVWFSALGGIAGTLSLILLAPPLAEIALSFSTFEYFWLAFLGLMCATMVARSSPVKAIASMLLGLLIACVGIENPGGVPRFTFGFTDLLGGIEVIPALVGVFAVSEVMRAMLTPPPPPMPRRKFGSIMAGQWMLTKKYPWPLFRGNIVGIIIGVLPGAGADMAAWVSYAMSKRFSREPEKFGTGHVEGLVEAGASNNASLASGWVPSLLFGIPGDTITAIAIGVLYMKGLNPGPTLFTEKASSMYAIYIMFILANIIMIPLGIAMIRAASYVLRAPRAAVMPVIILCCAVGSFATGANLFAVLTVAAFGMLGYVMEANGYPVAAMVLGIVMGTMVEQSFVTSLIKSDGSLLPFFERPVSAILAAMTIAALLWPVGVWLKRKAFGVASPPRPRKLRPMDSATAPQDVSALAAGLKAGDRTALARAITLIESRRADHRRSAQALLQSLLPETGRAIRLGVTGVPGVGKSTTIDALGTYLTGQGRRIAVLTVDPTSSRTGGSILADKTRMTRLAADPAAFIRPSPSGRTLGGVAAQTRETMLLCEAAGYDVVIVETVGIGQSETAVADMTDFFLVLMLSGAGDELQGLKKGVLELADMLAVNKADGDNVARAKAAAAEYRAAFHILRPRTPGWSAPVVTYSALNGDGVADLWRHVVEHRTRMQANGEFAARRREQQVKWMWSLLEQRLMRRVQEDAALARRLPQIEREVAEGKLSPALAVDEIAAALKL